MKKKYEIMVIFSNELKEADVEKHIDASIKKKLAEVGGSITFEDYWGAKGFAYIIKKQKWGFYYVAQFELDPQKIPELRTEWNIDKAILRFLISSVEEGAPEPKKYADLKAEYDALEKEAKKDAEPEQKIPSREKLTTVEKQTKEEEAPKETKVAKKEEGDAVDKKLNDIINDFSLDL